MPGSNATDIWLFGIDVSHYQGTIDWAEVKAGPTNFAFIKATESGDSIDPLFAQNWAGAEGLDRGAYHFFQPGVSGATQAENFLKAWKPAKGDLLPVLDLETLGGASQAELLSEVDAWMSAVTEAIGGKLPILYTDPGFWPQIGNPTQYSDHPLWVADYTEAKQPTLPDGWTTYAVWQYSDTGSVKGVSGNCDVDLFNGGPDAITTIKL